MSLPGLAASQQTGRELYAARCSWCHGSEGRGDGPAAEFLIPPPRDFTLGVYKWKSTPFDEMAPSEEDFVRMIKGGASHDGIQGWTGMNGTSMPGWNDTLSDGEIKELAGYIRSLGQIEKAEKPSIDTSSVKPSKEGVERGRGLYKDRCSECHGEEGRGDGKKRLKDDWGARTWPRDLTKGWTFRAGSSARDIYTRVTVGIPGTQMPSFADPKSSKKLTDEERRDVAVYAASLNEAYRKPGADMAIRAVKVEGDLPESPDGAAWSKAEYASFYLFPQIIAKERLYKPTVDSVSVKALYNDGKIAVLMEWDDPTRSLPNDVKAAELADGEVFIDGAAVQFPAGKDMPYFGMGDERPVDIWHWRSDGGEGLPQSIRLIRAKGFKNISEADTAQSGVSAKGVYDKGRWRVVFRGPLTGAGKEAGQIPAAFAAWDGSNGDRGSRHVLTGWKTITLEKKTGGGYFWAIVIALFVFAAELVWLRSAGKKN